MALLISLLAFASLLASPTLSTSLDNNAETTGKKWVGRLKQASAPIHVAEGEFFVNISIGTPPFVQRLFIDTDSDLLLANQCKTTSSSYSQIKSSSHVCKAMGGSNSNTNNDVCHYNYQYTSDSTIQVDMATEAITLDGSVKSTYVVLGCPTEGENENLGALGLGRGPLSLVSQLKVKNLAICLPSYDNPNKTGIVLFGDRVKTFPNMITTRLLKGSRKPSAHYVRFEGISVNNVLLNIPISTFAINGDGSGGVILDTGSTMTYFPKSVFDEIAKQIKSKIGLKVVSAPEDIGLPLCFDFPYEISINFKFPSIALHFDAANKMDLAVGSSFREYNLMQQNMTCLAMAIAPASDLGMSSLGNMQLQNTLVVIDLDNRKVLFRPNMECDNM
ncbi:hypothetical protein CASFOL_030918 [Castilleja foliolosa]|uniref:Peptidase A1 domain-containing protein n=1 Tax=Castilleja foliolosa TaxID=1961234 RepID=A0ABD3C827_9LAMI